MRTTQYGFGSVQEIRRRYVCTVPPPVPAPVPAGGVAAGGVAAARMAAACSDDPVQVWVTVPVAASIHSRVTDFGVVADACPAVVAAGTAVAVPTNAAASVQITPANIAMRRMSHLSLPDGAHRGRRAHRPGRCYPGLPPVGSYLSPERARM